MSSMSVGYHGHAFLHLNAITGVVIHADRTGDAVVDVADVVADDLAAGVVDRVAAAFDAGGDLPLLVRRLDPVAGVAAADRAGHGGQCLALAAADLVADQAADHRADRRASDAMLVLRRCGVRDGLVMADLLGVVHRRAHRVDGDDLAVLHPGIGARGHAVRTGRAGVRTAVAGRHSRHQRRGDRRLEYIDHQRVHHFLLLCLSAAYRPGCAADVTTCAVN